MNHSKIVYLKNRTNHFVSLNRGWARYIVLVTVFLFFSIMGHAQETDATEHFDFVISTHPVNITRGGLKWELGLNLKEKYVLGIYTSHISTRFARHYFTEDNNGNNSKIYPSYIIESNLGIRLKNYFTYESRPFNGYYMMMYAENGRVHEQYFSQLGAFDIIVRPSNQRYNRIGVGFGREWTAFNIGVLDVYGGLGFHNTAYNKPRIFQHVMQVNQPDQFYGFLGVGIGIGNAKNREKYTYSIEDEDASHTAEVKGAVTFDFNQLIKSGVGMSYYNTTGPQTMWRFSGFYRSNRESRLNIGESIDYAGFGASIERKYYPYKSKTYEGPYYSLGLGALKERARFTEDDGNGNFTTRPYEYLPVHLDFAIGATVIVIGSIWADLFVSNSFTFISKNRLDPYALSDHSPGIRTVIGLRAGPVIFKRK